MKYMILLYGSQQDYEAMAGHASERPNWTQPEFAAMAAFMQEFNQRLAESGELVETRGLTAPVHARRIQLRNGLPVITDGPYAETQEVLAGYWIVGWAKASTAPLTLPRNSRPVPGRRMPANR